MASVHKNDAKVREGIQYADEGARAGHARAYVFKAQICELTDTYSIDEKRENESQ